MHLSQRLLDAHIHWRKIRVWRHDTDDTAVGRVESGSNDTQNDVFGREDTRNLPLILHQYGRGVVLFHELCRLSDAGSDGDSSRRQSVQDRLEGWSGHPLPDSFHILDYLLRLA